MTRNREAYRSFVRTCDDLPVFFQDWYLDAVCTGGQWDAAVVEKGGIPVAVLPYFLKRKGPFRYITMPHLCRFQGPYLHPDWRQPDRELRLLRELAGQLPRVHAFRQHFHYRQTNWLPFYWRGYQQQTRYSYRLENLDDLDAVYANLHRDYRNNKLPRAAEQVELRTGLGAADFFAVAEKSFRRQGLSQPYPLSFLERLTGALEQAEAGRMFFAVDRQERIHSVALLAWDRESSYYLAAGDDPELRASGAGIWLTWQLITFTARDLGLPVFDFLGSMIEPIERVRRQFGAVQRPYFAVWHYHSPLFRALESLR